MNEVDVPSSGPRVQLVQPRLGEAEFEAIGRIVYEIAGIDLYRGKEALVRNRLVHRLRALGLERFDEYVARLEADTTGAELSELIDAITTNETSFFREPQHFEFLQQTVRSGSGARGARPERSRTRPRSCSARRSRRTTPSTPGSSRPTSREGCSAWHGAPCTARMG